MDKEMIGEVLYERMKEVGLGVNKLSEHVKVGPAQILRVMHGDGYTIDTLMKIIEPLGLEIQLVKRQGREFENGS